MGKAVPAKAGKARTHAPGLLVAANLLVFADLALTQGVSATPKPAAQSIHQKEIDEYLRARQAFEEKAVAYWNAVAEKRRLRNSKRRSNEPIGLDDYVFTQPPVYQGPPRPAGFEPPAASEAPKPDMPVVADFLKAAVEQFGFVPERPESDRAFKREYAKVAAAAGLTRDQVVRIYAFETGGNGAYDGQAGLIHLIHPKPGAKAISPAVGYNQLLSTNSIELLAEHGDRFIAALNQKVAGLADGAKAAMERKSAILRRMVAFTRTVPDTWSDHDKLSLTPGGMGIHAAVLDRDIGPLLQTQKLLDSVLFARGKGRATPLTAAELELMNFTGDGNGFDMVTMPAELRQRVPTANFFVRQGYERNPIARRTGTVAALVSAIEARMDQASQSPGARELAASF